MSKPTLSSSKVSGLARALIEELYDETRNEVRCAIAERYLREAVIRGATRSGPLVEILTDPQLVLDKPLPSTTE